MADETGRVRVHGPAPNPYQEPHRLARSRLARTLLAAGELASHGGPLALSGLGARALESVQAMLAHLDLERQHVLEPLRVAAPDVAALLDDAQHRQRAACRNLAELARDSGSGRRADACAGVAALYHAIVQFIALQLEVMHLKELAHSAALVRSVDAGTLESMRLQMRDGAARMHVARGAASRLLPSVATHTAQPQVTDRQCMQVRRFREHHTVFLDGNYLIRGVAGVIVWKLLSDYIAHGRTDFSNRELRLDLAGRSPGIGENLEARLVLLQRRLAAHGPDLRIERTGRGRFKLVVQRPLQLQDDARLEPASRRRDRA